MKKVACKARICITLARFNKSSCLFYLTYYCSEFLILSLFRILNKDLIQKTAYWLIQFSFSTVFYWFFLLQALLFWHHVLLYYNIPKNIRSILYFCHLVPRGTVSRIFHDKARRSNNARDDKHISMKQITFQAFLKQKDPIKILLISEQLHCVQRVEFTSNFGFEKNSNFKQKRKNNNLVIFKMVVDPRGGWWILGTPGEKVPNHHLQ